jgi:uncharacterized membrane protein
MLTDGLFAIVMTLLVLEITVPQLSCGGKENIPQSPEVVKILSDFAYISVHRM